MDVRKIGKMDKKGCVIIIVGFVVAILLYLLVGLII